MKSRFDPVTMTFFLLFSSGYFAESQVNWTFTLPDSIEASVHSTVEIPCTFSAPEEPGNFLLTRYMIDRYGGNDHQQVYNSNDSRKVSEEYRGRTTLIGHGNNCTLRITDVTYTAWYYPEIRGGSCKLSKEQKPVRINVTGCLNRPSCSEWSFTFPSTIKALTDSCVFIPCTVTHPDKATDFDIFMFLRNPTGDTVFYNFTTSISGRSKCSLTINNIQRTRQYYPGVNRVINAYNLEGRVCTVTVSDIPPRPVITGAENLKESEAINITCAVTHSCSLRPPMLQWNVPNNTTVTHIDLTQGYWEVQSKILYFPSSKNNDRSLECSATFRSGQTSVQKVTLQVEVESRTSVAIIIIIAGVAGLLLLVLFVIIYKRKKICHTSDSNGVGAGNCILFQYRQ
ncbi:B-cell receptor CD22-like [Dendropsophus ebraccatus]|uniref:B-cell receptor CD22-like n=1 Tax=Dendropsophus ebraccatus TaxID=150705 RepID=UPI003831F058